MMPFVAYLSLWIPGIYFQEIWMVIAFAFVISLVNLANLLDCPKLKYGIDYYISMMIAWILVYAVYDQSWGGITQASYFLAGLVPVGLHLMNTKVINCKGAEDE